MPTIATHYDFAKNDYAVQVADDNTISIQAKKKHGRDATVLQRMVANLSSSTQTVCNAKTGLYSTEDIKDLKTFAKELTSHLENNKFKKLINSAQKVTKLLQGIKEKPSKAVSKVEAEVAKLLEGVRKNAFEKSGKPLKDLGNLLVKKASALQDKTIYQAAQKVFFSRICGMLLTGDAARQTLIKTCLQHAIKIDTDLKKLESILKQDHPDDSVTLLVTELEDAIAQSKKPDDEPFVTLNRIIKRYEQIASADFEKTPLSKLEILNIAYFIEVRIHKVENLAIRYFAKNETGLARSLQINLRKKEVYLLANYENSLFQEEGSFKRVANAVQLPFEKLKLNPEVVAQLVTKTEETITEDAREKEIAATRREIQFSKRLKNAPRGIAQVLAVASFTETISANKQKLTIPKLSIVVEKSHGNLYRVLKDGKTFQEKEEFQIADDLIQGVNHMHEENLVHGDLKPENFLFWIDSNGVINQAKVTDFGFSFEFDYADLAAAEITKVYKLGLYGTPGYTAPELLGSLNFHGDYAKTDVFALGTSLYHLHFGKKGKWHEMLDKHDTDNYDNTKLCFKDAKKLQKAQKSFKSIIQNEVEEKLKKLPPKDKAEPKVNFERLIYQMLLFDPKKRIDMKTAVKEMGKIKECSKASHVKKNVPKLRKKNRS
jgi:serine/threonine protein kinase